MFALINLITYLNHSSLYTAGKRIIRQLGDVAWLRRIYNNILVTVEAIKNYTDICNAERKIHANTARKPLLLKVKSTQFRSVMIPALRGRKKAPALQNAIRTSKMNMQSNAVERKGTVFPN